MMTFTTHGYEVMVLILYNLSKQQTNKQTNKQANKQTNKQMSIVIQKLANVL